MHCWWHMAATSIGTSIRWRRQIHGSYIVAAADLAGWTLHHKSPSPLVSTHPVPDVSIVIPTFKEVENIRPLHASICASLKMYNWELIYVDDDSPDGTADAVRDLAQEDVRVRCIQRIGRRGLSTAVVEGALSSAAPWIA